jgi:nitroimidazol reductase NimA-like FMN-containing flavoprotein (pyridoxamine 5'-phosphate oxidase superfamily)
LASQKQLAEKDIMVKQIMTSDEIDKLLSRALVGRLGTCKNKQPYVIPMCFVYYKNKIYFHCAPQGRKMENVKANPNVCFQVDEHQLVSSYLPCKFNMRYQSVMIFGKVHFLRDLEEKLKVLRMMMDKYDINKIAKPLEKSMVVGIEIGEIIIEKITGKKKE